ncbi:acryloyl-CoA reductase [Lentilactobacillus sp. Marseille-Q4993]|uniref:acrylyl-CoA reductase family protein n=1 Tax=Lentilactobacillus sp. Marseille-Q4993 TaxID=3039492 RepID=UPI0024BD100A|nr:acryloyl-CoA reductase [Lentilactobacillus sp. Marseille-Q4993]
MNQFKALVVNEVDGKVEPKIESVSIDELSAGNVIVKINYSSINYKDMLGVQTNGGVIRTYPMIPGIDFSGQVVESGDSAFKPGDDVLLTGYKVGMSHTGGFAEYARVPAEWLVKMPADMTSRQAMTFGTAGFTAALCIQKLLANGMKPSHRVLVTGATGGVGSVAVRILKKLGFGNVAGLVRNFNKIDNDVRINWVGSGRYEAETKPLGEQEFDYVVDSVGGSVLAKILPHISYGGAVATCGNAAGVKLETTVFPFILRGVSLLGVDSVFAGMDQRREVWSKLANEWNVSDEINVEVVHFSDIQEALKGFKQKKSNRYIVMF